MRYIGNKRNLIDDIDLFVRKHVPSEILGKGVFLDLFAGSNSVSRHFKQFMPIITNDNMYFSYVLSRGATVLNKAPDFSELFNGIGIADALSHLNKLSGDELRAGFIADNYTTYGSERTYLSPENGIKVDTIRTTIDYWLSLGLIDDDGYYYLLACLIEAVSMVSNTKGSYAAFLKNPDARMNNPLELEHPILIDNHSLNKAHCGDANPFSLATPAHVCYIDPPYSQQQYTSNYHLLETICRYDKPVIKGKTGIREYNDSDKSRFCSKVSASQAMFDLIKSCQSPHIIISYTSRGVLDIATIKQALAKFCDPASIAVRKFDYHTYKGRKTRTDTKSFEYLIYAHKPSVSTEIDISGVALRDILPNCIASYSLLQSPDSIIKSPINYSTSQQNYLPQLLKLMPDDINEFVDVFAGGLDVAINAPAKKTIVNDIKTPIVDMLKFLAKTNIDEIINELNTLINKYKLSRINTDGFLHLRRDYNKNPSPILLYLLICHSYNHQFRFNSKLEYNSHFGKNRAFFSKPHKRALINYNSALSSKDISYHALDFKVFMDSVEVSDKALFYCHPPSKTLLDNSSSLERGFPLWTMSSQTKLHAMLDDLDDRGYRFMLVETLSFDDVTDKALRRWAKRYKSTPVDGSRLNIEQIIITNY